MDLKDSFGTLLSSCLGLFGVFVFNIEDSLRLHLGVVQKLCLRRTFPSGGREGWKSGLDCSKAKVPITECPHSSFLSFSSG